jgi:hypothetical protein
MARPDIPSELKPVYEGLEAHHQALVDTYYGAGRADLALEYLKNKFPEKGGLQTMQPERTLSEFDLAKSAYGVPEDLAKKAIGRSQIQVSGQMGLLSTGDAETDIEFLQRTEAPSVDAPFSDKLDFLLSSFGRQPIFEKTETGMQPKQRISKEEAAALEIKAYKSAQEEKRLEGELSEAVSKQSAVRGAAFPGAGAVPLPGSKAAKIAKDLEDTKEFAADVEADQRIAESTTEAAFRVGGAVLAEPMLRKLNDMLFTFKTVPSEEDPTKFVPLDPTDFQYRLSQYQEELLEKAAVDGTDLYTALATTIPAMEIRYDPARTDIQPPVGDFMIDAATAIQKGEMLGTDFMMMPATYKLYEKYGFDNAPMYLGLATGLAMPLTGGAAHLAKGIGRVSADVVSPALKAKGMQKAANVAAYGRPLMAVRNKRAYEAVDEVMGEPLDLSAAHSNLAARASDDVADQFVTNPAATKAKLSQSEKTQVYADNLGNAEETLEASIKNADENGAFRNNAYDVQGNLARYASQIDETAPKPLREAAADVLVATQRKFPEAGGVGRATDEVVTLDKLFETSSAKLLKELQAHPVHMNRYKQMYYSRNLMGQMESNIAAATGADAWRYINGHTLVRTERYDEAQEVLARRNARYQEDMDIAAKDTPPGGVATKVTKEGSYRYKHSQEVADRVTTELSPSAVSRSRFWKRTTEKLRNDEPLTLNEKMRVDEALSDSFLREEFKDYAVQPTYVSRKTHQRSTKPPERRMPLVRAAREAIFNVRRNFLKNPDPTLYNQPISVQKFQDRMIAEMRDPSQRFLDEMIASGNPEAHLADSFRRAVNNDKEGVLGVLKVLYGNEMPLELAGAYKGLKIPDGVDPLIYVVEKADEVLEGALPNNRLQLINRRRKTGGVYKDTAKNKPVRESENLTESLIAYTIQKVVQEPAVEKAIKSFIDENPGFVFDAVSDKAVSTYLRVLYEGKIVPNGTNTNDIIRKVAQDLFGEQRIEKATLRELRKQARSAQRAEVDKASDLLKEKRDAIREAQAEIRTMREELLDIERGRSTKTIIETRFDYDFQVELAKEELSARKAAVRDAAEIEKQETRLERMVESDEGARAVAEEKAAAKELSSELRTQRDVQEVDLELERLIEAEEADELLKSERKQAAEKKKALREDTSKQDAIKKKAKDQITKELARRDAELATIQNEYKEAAASLEEKSKVYNDIIDADLRTAYKDYTDELKAAKEDIADQQAQVDFDQAVEGLREAMTKGFNQDLSTYQKVVTGFRYQGSRARDVLESFKLASKSGAKAANNLFKEYVGAADSAHAAYMIERKAAAKASEKIVDEINAIKEEGIASARKAQKKALKKLRKGVSSSKEAKELSRVVQRATDEIENLIDETADAIVVETSNLRRAQRASYDDAVALQGDITDAFIGNMKSVEEGAALKSNQYFKTRTEAFLQATQQRVKAYEGRKASDLKRATEAKSALKSDIKRRRDYMKGVRDAAKDAAKKRSEEAQATTRAQRDVAVAEADAATKKRVEMIDSELGKLKDELDVMDVESRLSTEIKIEELRKQTAAQIKALEDEIDALVDAEAVADVERRLQAEIALDEIRAKQAEDIAKLNADAKEAIAELRAAKDLEVQRLTDERNAALDSVRQDAKLEIELLDNELEDARQSVRSLKQKGFDEPVPTEAQIDDMSRRLVESRVGYSIRDLNAQFMTTGGVGMKGIEATSDSLRFQLQQLDDSFAMMPRDLQKGLQAWKDQDFISQVTNKFNQEELGQLERVFSSFVDFTHKSRRQVTSGLLGGPLLAPTMRFLGVNIGTLPLMGSITIPGFGATTMRAIPASVFALLPEGLRLSDTIALMNKRSLGETSRRLAKAMPEKAKEVLQFVGRSGPADYMRVGQDGIQKFANAMRTVRPGARDPMLYGIPNRFVTRDGRVYSKADVFQMAKEQNFANQVTYELGDNIIREIQFAAGRDALFQPLGGMDTLVTGTLGRNRDLRNYWNYGGLTTDRAFRESVFIEAMKRGYTPREARIIGDNVGLDYNDIPQPIRQGLARNAVFFSFFYKMFTETMTAPLRPGGLQNLHRLIRLSNTNDEKLKEFMFPDYIRTRAYVSDPEQFGTQAIATVGPSIPPLESIASLGTLVDVISSDAGVEAFLELYARRFTGYAGQQVFELLKQNLRMRSNKEAPQSRVPYQYVQAAGFCATAFDSDCLGGVADKFGWVPISGLEAQEKMINPTTPDGLQYRFGNDYSRTLFTGASAVLQLYRLDRALADYSTTFQSYLDPENLSSERAKAVDPLGYYLGVQTPVTGVTRKGAEQLYLKESQRQLQGLKKPVPVERE